MKILKSKLRSDIILRRLDNSKKLSEISMAISKEQKKTLEKLVNLTNSNQISWKYNKNHLFSGESKAWFNASYENYEIISNIEIISSQKDNFQMWISIKKLGTKESCFISYNKETLPLVQSIINQTGWSKGLYPKPTAISEFIVEITLEEQRDDNLSILIAEKTIWQKFKDFIR